MKWYLISEDDVKEMSKLLGQDLVEKVRDILNTGLHTTDCVPKDFKKFFCKSCNGQIIFNGHHWIHLNSNPRHMAIPIVRE